MKLNTILSLCYLTLASASFLDWRAAVCNDNCGRQISGNRPGSPDVVSRSADCLKALVDVTTITVTPTITVSTVLSTVTTVDTCMDDLSTATSTSTVDWNITLSSLTTVGETSTVSTRTMWSNTTTSSTSISTTTLAVLATVTDTAIRTAVTTFVTTPNARKLFLTTSVPSYASSCTRPGAYESACSCLLGHSLATGASTVTVTANVTAVALETKTIVVPSTTTIGFNVTSTSVGGTIVTETTTSFVTEILSATSTASEVLSSTTSETTTSVSTTTAEVTVTSVAACTATRPVLTSPTGVIPDIKVNRSLPASNSDGFFKIFLPFPIKLYNVSSTEVFMATNGVLFLRDPTGPPVLADTSLIETYNSSSVGWSNTALPAQPCNATFGSYKCKESSLPSYALAAFWDDLLLAEGTTQGLWYEITQVETPLGKQKSVIFEWYTTHEEALGQVYHFTVQFFELNPSWITITYYSVANEGTSGTVEFNQFSFNSHIESGLVLDYDPVNKDWIKSNKNVC